MFAPNFKTLYISLKATLCIPYGSQQQINPSRIIIWILNRGTPASTIVTFNSRVLERKAMQIGVDNTFSFYPKKQRRSILKCIEVQSWCPIRSSPFCSDVLRRTHSYIRQATLVTNREQNRLANEGHEVARTCTPLLKPARRWLRRRDRRAEEITCGRLQYIQSWLSENHP